MRSYGVDTERLARLGAPAESWRKALQRRCPRRILRSTESLELSVAFGDYLFVHAGVRPGVPLDAQTEADLIWIRGPFLDHAEPFGKIVVHGHTPGKEPVTRSNRIGIDTGACFTGRLTALRLQDGSRDFFRPEDQGRFSCRPGLSAGRSGCCRRTCERGALLGARRSVWQTSLSPPRLRSQRPLPPRLRQAPPAVSAPARPMPSAMASNSGAASSITGSCAAPFPAWPVATAPLARARLRRLQLADRAGLDIGLSHLDDHARLLHLGHALRPRHGKDLRGELAELAAEQQVLFRTVLARSSSSWTLESSALSRWLSARVRASALPPRMPPPPPASSAMRKRSMSAR